MSRTTQAGDAPRRGARGPSRRILLRTGFTAVVAAGTAAVLTPLHDRPQDTAPGQGPGRATAGAAGAEEFAEMYRGREIRGGVSVLVPAAGPGDGRAHHGEPVAEIRIDGRPLHVMQRADGTYLSDVTHYESFPTLRETARAAVDELGTARLALPASRHR